MTIHHRPHRVIGWDVGGAHLKAALVEDGRVHEVVQWPCELWRGLSRLDAAFEHAFARGSHWRDAHHAVTMTGEMADLFEHREAGVAAIVTQAAATLGARTSFYAADATFLPATSARVQWRRVASANWHATATIVAGSRRDALLLDVGSTTTDIVPIVAGRLVAQGRDDASRLATGELVYVGVVRTPLCALAPSVTFESCECNVMNEFFATTADVFRLTDELRPEHDQAPTADQGAKDGAATMRRLARMIGRDAREATPGQWHAFARTWREAVIGRICASVARVVEACKMPPDAPIVGAGCGSFITAEVARRAHRRFMQFDDVVPVDRGCGEWARTCAPAVAVALLRTEVDRCGS
ncbi:MAG TPA: hydantoinase/oxoprolinase family protein [Rhodanobacteraceae bacterium]